MKIQRIINFFLVQGYLLLFSATGALAQDAAGDSLFYQKVLTNTKTVYHQSFGNQSALYNGSRYNEYPFRFKEGIAFYNSDKPGIGSIVYDGITYDSVLIRYDEIKDVLSINDKINRIQLLSERVERFTVFNSNFVRLEKDSLTADLASSGFYNILYEGKISLLNKQEKYIWEVISGNSELVRYAGEKNHFYLKRAGRFFPVHNKKEFFRLLKDRKREVQQFVKASGLSYRKDRQNMLTRATAYYDSLKN